MMFIACNVPKFLEEQMNKMKDALTGGMNEDNLKGFEYAVDTMLSILRQTIHAAEMDDEILVHNHKFFGFELDEYYYKVSKQRLDTEMAQMRLSDFM